MKIKLKKRNFYLILVLIFLIIIIFISISILRKPSWYVSEDGILHYPENRGKIEFSRNKINESANWTEEKVIFPSKNTRIYGLLFLQKNGKAPGIVLLPGGGVTKDNERRVAVFLANIGYNVLTIDQRGVEETDGYFPSFEQDFESFKNNIEPNQHLMIYDALRSSDLLRSLGNIEPKQIIYMGESMGGRIAIIATALDKNSRGAIIISSSGYHITEQTDPKLTQFFLSIDPDSYIDKISPRKIVMIHSENDKTIPLNDAQITFSKAKNPERFIIINNEFCGHGYCEAMNGYIKEELENYVKKTPP